MVKPVTKAVFPVAGLGTRFLPATKSIPKEIMTLVDRPLIQYAIDEARAADITDFIFVTSRGKSALEDYFDRAPELENALEQKGKTALSEVLEATNMPSGAISYVRQQTAMGLGHAVWCARRLIGDEPFAVLLPDDVIMADKPVLAQMIDAYGDTGGCMMAAMEVEPDQASAYGILDLAGRDGDVLTVKGMVEKPKSGTQPSNMAVIGRYILTPDVLEELHNTSRGAGGEIQLTDAIASQIGRDPGVRGLAFKGERYDCGNKGGFLQATVAFGMARDDLGPDFRAYLSGLNLNG